MLCICLIYIYIYIYMYVLQFTDSRTQTAVIYLIYKKEPSIRRVDAVVKAGNS